VARQPLIRVLALAAAAAVGLGACETRSVFLVPRASVGAGGASIIHVGDAGAKHPLHGDAGAGGASAGSGGKPAKDATVPTLDAGDVSCVATRNQQIPQPLGVYVVIDQSNAMLQQWDMVSAGLQDFIRGSDELGGISVGIQYYALSPRPAPPSYLDIVCKWDSYETPDVQIGLLPTNQQPLLDSIAIHGPLSLTQLISKLSLTLSLVSESPIDAAIQGAVQGARDWLKKPENVGKQPAAAVLLVTNGVASALNSPNCMPTAEKAANAALTGSSSDPVVPTYVLGVGGPNEDLNHIAYAGGTNAAYPVTAGADVLANLLNIRQAFLPCDVSISATDQDLTGGKLNVELDEAGKTPERYGRVENALACSPVAPPGEWYVEGTGSDAKVRLCPSTCDAVHRVKDATLDVVHGCQTTFIH